MIIDQTGTLANIKRHDYLPFGEELFAPAGGRSTALGYAGGDGTRQQFTSQERDVETGLDYFFARYYSSAQGRFTSVDPLLASGRSINPQSWNRYTYTLNNPLRFTDPTGLQEEDHSGLGKADPCKLHKCQKDSSGNVYYLDGNGDEIWVINAEQVVPDAERGFLTVEQALQQQEQRRQSFILNNILAAVGHGIGRAFSGIGGFFRGRGAAPSPPPARIALDTNVLIGALDAGELAAVDAALSGRAPVISITAAKEYLAKGDIAVLRAFLQSRGGGVGAAATQADIQNLQAQAQVLGRVLSSSDAAVAGSAMREGVPLMTNDQRLFNFLKAVGYPVEKF